MTRFERPAGQDRLCTSAGWTAMVLTLATIAVAGCAASGGLRVSRPDETVNLPLVQGWFEGRRAFYVTTDVSDPEMARRAGANYVPRLANALPPEPKVPGTPSSIDRIYMVTNFKQGNVLPSAPQPLGPGNSSNAYSPLGQIVTVSWKTGETPVLLRSEQEVLGAEDAGRVILEPLRVIANCPVVRIEGDFLPGASLPGSP